MIICSDLAGVEVVSVRSLNLAANWYKVDFHVHTPASRCFEGTREGDEAYYGFLRKVRETDVSVVVITDHNTLDGYMELVSLRDRLDGYLGMLNEDNQPVPEIYAERRALYNDLVLLPGVEVSVYPNLHFLVAFRPCPEIEAQVDAFLSELGLPSDARACETSAGDLQPASVLLEHAEKLGALVIAAHCDTHHGVYEEGRAWGNARREIITDSRLHGLEYSNEGVREQITNLLRNDPAWHRAVPLAFVRGSDFHCGPAQAIATPCTWARMLDFVGTDISAFEGIRRALGNPDEFVSPHGRPEVEAIRRKLAVNPYIGDPTDPAQIARLVELVCAQANTQRGAIIVGRNNHGNWTGVRNVDASALGDILVESLVDGIKPAPRFDVTVYENDEQSYFASIVVHSSPDVHWIVRDGEVFVLQDGTATKADTEAIVKLAEDTLLGRFSTLSATKRIAEETRRLAGIHDSMDLIPPLRRLLNQSEPFGKLFQTPGFGTQLSETALAAVEFPPNGVLAGDIVMVTGDAAVPRLADQYIRFTAPLGLCAPDNPELVALERFEGEKLLFCEQGGAFLDATARVAVTSRVGQVYVCYPRPETPPLRYVLGYLKSSLYIWYRERCSLPAYADQPLHFLLALPIPLPATPESAVRVVSVVDAVLGMEHTFLSTWTAVREEGLKERQLTDRLNELVNAHNRAVAPLMAQLDSLFFDVLEFSLDYQRIVREVAGGSGMAVFLPPRESGG
jgi:hypothetical protein